MKKQELDRLNAKHIRCAWGCRKSRTRRIWKKWFNAQQKIGDRICRLHDGPNNKRKPRFTVTGSALRKIHEDFLKDLATAI